MPTATTNAAAMVANSHVLRGQVVLRSRVKAGRGETGVEFCSGLTLRLTEFPDPQGKCVYFRLPDLSAAVPDELLSGGPRDDGAPAFR